MSGRRSGPLSGWLRPALLPLFALLLAACSPTAEVPGETAAVIAPKNVRPAADEFSVMTWNLDRFCFTDRNGDGQPNEFKPDPEVQAALDLIAGENPDILACQEIGEGPAFQSLRDELKKRGLDYPHAEQLVRPGTAAHLALLSRHPLIATNFVTTESYTIQGQQFPVLHGFLCAEIDVDGRYRFKLLVAQLKSKSFAESGQTEMRRNEARLLNKVVRNQLAADTTNQNYIVLGDLGDRPESSALNEVLGKQQRVLADLRPLDAAGEAWTRFDPADDTYERNDYILCSADMLREAVTQKCHIVRGLLVQRASDHRPLTAIFRTRDL